MAIPNYYENDRMAIPNYYENDVALAINSLINSSPGWDNIPTLIEKHVILLYF